MTDQPLYAPIPLQWVGPLRFSGNVIDGEEVSVPLATYESPLWPSVKRGAKVSAFVDGGIRATLVDERMSRSVYFRAEHAGAALAAAEDLRTRREQMQEVVSGASRFARLVDLHVQHAGNLLFVRFEFTTGDASGHNMVTLAADHLMPWILQLHPELEYGSISGNFCSDKKATAVNGILGRGKNVVTELTIPRRIVQRLLKSTPEAIARLNTEKNLIGTTLAGGLRSANAHYANMLLAFYLATGQDAANIVEGSQGITQAECATGTCTSPATCPASSSARWATARARGWRPWRRTCGGWAAARSASPGPTPGAWPCCARARCCAGSCPCWPPRPIRVS